MQLRSVHIQQAQRRGVALLEVIIAAGLLAFSVASISSAIVAGQKQSTAARKSIVATVAAESLLSQLSLEPWETIDSWHGYIEDVGTIADPSGSPIGGDWDSIGRRVSIAETNVYIDMLEVFIVGRTITVTAFSENGDDVTSVDRFITEPQS